MVKKESSKSILIKRNNIDSWFITHYGMNLYRGCSHDCLYCDGRSETYGVEGFFNGDIVIKENAVELLSKELNPYHKRSPFPRSFIMIGGGICDAYQPIEGRYQLTRQTLKLINKYSLPVHILTKGVLIERDLDLLKEINKKNNVLISFSFSSVNDSISKTLEPGVESPSKRLKLLEKMKQMGFNCGVFMMPLIPLITDVTIELRRSLEAFSKINVDYVVYGTLTLKKGRQENYFMDYIKKFYPQYEKRYMNNYNGRRLWGGANQEYIEYISKKVYKLCQEYQLNTRIPVKLFKETISRKDMCMIILKHMAFYHSMEGISHSLHKSASVLSKLSGPFTILNLHNILSEPNLCDESKLIIKSVINKGHYEAYDQKIF